MAVRHYTEITNINNDRFRMEVVDSGWASGSTEILSGSSVGFELSYPVAKGKFPGVLPSEFKYWIAIENNGQGNFISDLSLYSADRFTLNVYKWSGSAWVIWWGGVFAPNLAKYEDLGYPYIFEIVATDGIAKLRNEDYNNAGTEYTGESTLIDVVAKILKKLPNVVSLWTGSTDFIRTIVDYYENSATYDSTHCPLYYTSVSERAFYTLDNAGVKKWMRCDAVLNNILEMFNCQMYQCEGKWLIQQIDERSKTSFLARKYAYTIAAPTAAASMYGKKDIDPGDANARLAGGAYDWMPTLKKVTIKYNAQERRNLIGGLSWTQSSGTSHNVGNVDYNTGTAALRVTGTINAGLQNGSAAVGNFYYPLFKFTIKVGTKYLKRSITLVAGQLSAGPTTWETSASLYEYTTGLFQAPAVGLFYNINGPVDFSTPPLLESGDMVVEFTLSAVSAVTSGGSWTTYWSLSDGYIEALSNGAAVTNNNDLEYSQTQPDGTGEDEYEIKTMFADGPTVNSAGRLKVGSAGTDLWGLGGGPYDKPLTELLMSQLLRSMATPKKRMRGAVTGAQFPFYYILDDGGDEWVFIGGTYSGTMSTLRGEWLKLDAGTATYDPPIIKYTDVYTPTNAPGLSNPGGLGSSGLQNMTPATLEPISAAKTSAVKVPGAVTSIPVSTALSVRAFVVDQVLSLVNPANGHSDTVIVTADSIDGDTSIAVSGTLTDTYGEGSYVVVRIDNYTTSGGLPSATGTVTSVAATAPTAGFTISGSPITGAGTLAFTLSDDLAALEAQSGTGLIARTAANTYAQRTITAGTGISVANGGGVAGNPTITNSAPDQTVALTAGDSIGITGTYPNFTITNLSPDQAVALTAGTGISISGTYPNFTITNSVTAYTDEQAQDAVGTILTDSVRIDFTYNDAANTITADLTFNSVADAYLSQRGALTVMGRATNSTGNVADIIATTDGHVLRRSGTTLGFGTVATAGITDAAVTYVKIQNVTATSRVLGRITAGAGVVEELTVANLYTILGITGVAGRNAFFTGTNTLVTSANWLWDNTNNRATITGTTTGTGANTGILNLNSGALGAATEFLRMSGNVSANMIASLLNSNNATVAANSIYAISVGGGSAGDPTTQYNILGVVTHSIGIDNSDSDKFKVTPNASAPGGNVDKSFVVTNDATPKYGFNIDAPARDVDISGVSRSKQWVNTSAVPTVTIDVPGTGLGTGGTIDIVDGCNNGFYVVFSTGTAPTANGVLFTCTLVSAFTTAHYPVMCQGNIPAANEWSKFVFNGFAPGTIKLKANGTLTASTQYRIHFLTIGL